MLSISSQLKILCLSNVITEACMYRENNQLVIKVCSDLYEVIITTKADTFARCFEKLVDVLDEINKGSYY